MLFSSCALVLLELTCVCQLLRSGDTDIIFIFRAQMDRSVMVNCKLSPRQKEPQIKAECLPTPAPQPKPEPQQVIYLFMFLK